MSCLQESHLSTIRLLRVWLKQAHASFGWYSEQCQEMAAKLSNVEEQYNAGNFENFKVGSIYPSWRK